MTEVTGTCDFVVGDETFKTWYRVLGDLHSGIRPLVLLHGGPGIPHHGLLNHNELYKAHSIPVLWYDQLGCGASTHLPHKPEEFWTPELFMDELENLLRHLEIADNFDVLGHSWGGMMVSQWAASRSPPGLKRIVIINSPASMSLWDECNALLLSQMPQDFQDRVNKHQKDETFEDPEYRELVKVYYAKHACRCDPWPEAVTKSHEEMAKDPTVCRVMCGSNVFKILGKLHGWDVTPILHKISQPTLLVNGRYDMAQDIAVAPFFEKIPKAKWVHLSESSHMPYWEEPERYYQAVGQFLTA